MQLIDMQHHSSGIMPSPGRNPLHGCLHPGEKPPKTNQSMLTGAAIGTVGLACLVQLIGSWCWGNSLRFSDLVDLLESRQSFIPERGDLCSAVRFHGPLASITRKDFKKRALSVLDKLPTIV